MSKEAQRLFELCENEDFDIEEATQLISILDVNEPVIDPSRSREYKTTFLMECVTNTNLKMAQLLLENGADPNMILNDENAFWDLQYNDYSDEEYEEGNYAYATCVNRFSPSTTMQGLAPYSSIS